MTTKYDNCEWERLARTGGSVVVTIGFDPDYGALGVHPVSLPCRGCWVSSRPIDAWDDQQIVSIGTGREPWNRGVYLPISRDGQQPMWMPVSDVSQLYFSGKVGDHIDIVYLLG